MSDVPRLHYHCWTLSAVSVRMVALTQGIADLAKDQKVHRLLNGSFGFDPPIVHLAGLQAHLQTFGTCNLT